ncbi:hypothetical protein TNCV_2553791 [Trichonephila clavipes]|nr:hypothetical protein TNCV_2553791 [Trichonephila clavipes]
MVVRLARARSSNFPVSSKRLTNFKRPADENNVAGLLHQRLRVRPRLKSVDFNDAENRQWSCRMIKRHVKDP